ncbi:MAG: acyl-ACP--UDP-N-acetylglucosamine O-acyltransferase [Verrucomicrobiae bacterium]|nr:acyl-ACP--UDP-N-acetylglucosamine O-acyltransferase [Verrucomicrobiae bacterium]MDW8344135.1 acyl-ACP--UDP-N-acetylglucosamine O-acyltransferase [Verrucomicrobiae bacterium]
MAIHPTAIVSPKAELDSSVEVGPYAVIEDGVRLGARTRVGAHAYLARGTSLGEDNEVHVGAVLGHEPQDLRFRCGTRSYLRVGNRNVFREYCTVHRGTEPESATVIGDDCYLMAGSHVGHNCVLGNHVILCNCALLAGYVQVGDRAFISGGVVIHQFMRVGRLAMLSGNARVSMDVPPFVIAAERNEVHAINQVGLKRAGVKGEAVREIKALFRLFYRSGLTTSEALAQARGFCTSEAAEFLEFVRNSPNGLCPPARRGAG